jgi:hypothetical protein
VEDLKMSETAKKCPQCAEWIGGNGVKVSITDRGWDSIRRKQYVRTRELLFCSQVCGGHYQMGCEG